jgi:hypothetical protein
LLDFYHRRLNSILFVLTMALGSFITYKAVNDWYYTSGGFVLITPLIALIGIVFFFIVPQPVKADQPAPLEISADTEEVIKTTETAEVTGNANFRKGPSTNDAVIRRLMKGDLVLLTGEVSGGWTQILRDGKTGWISSEFLSKWGGEKTAAAQTAAQTKPQTQMQKQNAEA